MGLRTRKNKKWTTGSIYLILKNETYTGKIRRGIKKGDCELFEGLHTPIIDGNTFKKVKKIFKKRSNGRAKYLYR